MMNHKYSFSVFFMYLISHNVYILEWTWTLPLIPGKRYFSTVESCNMAGLCSQSSSNGIVIDPSPPTPGFVSIGAENVKYIPQRLSNIYLNISRSVFLLGIIDLKKINIKFHSNNMCFKQ